MKKPTKIIAAIAATFVLIASIATVSLFKTDDSQMMPTTTLSAISTTLLPTQPLETVSAFDWEAYLGSIDLSTEPESSTDDPSAPVSTNPVSSPNIIISYVYVTDNLVPTEPTSKQEETGIVARTSEVDTKQNPIYENAFEKLYKLGEKGLNAARECISKLRGNSR